LSAVTVTTIITRAHSFSRQNLTKTRGEFGKFRGLPRQGRWNSATHREYTLKFPRLD